MIINYKKINFLVNDLIFILPILLLFFAELLTKLTDSTSSSLKLAAWGFMFIVIIIHNKYNRILLFISILFLAILLINIFNTFNMQAALEELIRFLFLPVVLAFGYVYRYKIDLLIKLLILMALLSNIFQVYVYINGFFGIGPEIIPIRVKDGGYALNVGFLGVSNAILNFVAFMLVLVFKDIKYRNILMPFFFIFTILTFSYKTIPFAILSLFLFTKIGLKGYIFMAILFLATSFYFFEYLLDMNEILSRKIETYILVGDSARYESYRVMFEFLSQFNLLGEGLGSFGGPSSIFYNSPIYAKYGFNWFGITNITTTDTYYPHLFVELSWIGGITFLLLMFLPIFQGKLKKARKLNLFILSAFLFEALFAFSLNSLIGLVCTVMLFYGINYKYEERQYEKNIINK